MSKLPDGFEKDYLLLLEPIVSDGAIKNRRNLLVASFSIFTVYALGKSLTDIRVFGLDLHGSDPKILLLLSLSILIFWALMFVAHSVKDFDINRERKHLLEKHIDAVKNRIEGTRDKAEKSDHFRGEHNSAKRQFEIYEKQQIRVKKAILFSKLTFTVEYCLPILISIISSCYIIKDLYSTW